ncbi:MAG: hypothetical protein ACRD3S_08490 [Terracidiphilus sp.]
MFTIHAGEYLVGDYIERKFGKRWNVWIPSKDTGIDLLVTDKKNHRTASLQVKFGKDFLPGKSADLRKQLRCHSWFTLARVKLHRSKAEFWVFVLPGFASNSPDFIVVPTAKLRRHMDQIHGRKENLQVYLTSTKRKCWETRTLRNEDLLKIAKDTYENPKLNLSEYMNGVGWNAVKATLED